MSESGASGDLCGRIEAVLDARCPPRPPADGGDVELVGVDADRIVQVRILGLVPGLPLVDLSR